MINLFVQQAQGVDNGVEFAVHDPVQGVPVVVHAVVGETILREVIGADLFASFAGADLALARGRSFRVRFFDHVGQDARAQKRHGFGAVLRLRAFFHAHNDRAGRLVGNAHRRFGLVHVLSAGAARAHRVDLQVVGINFKVNFFGLRKHGDGGGRSMDAALLFRGRHALDAVHAAFEFERTSKHFSR